MRRIIGPVSVMTVLLALHTPAVAADGEKEKKIVVNEQMVLYGNAQKFSKPATLKSADVFKNIPAYKQIQSEGLTQKDAKYWILLEQANQVFSKSLAEVAKDKSYDLVTEAGGITADGVTIPDITAAVNEKVKT
jgi:hypothetical protein